MHVKKESPPPPLGGEPVPVQIGGLRPAPVRPAKSVSLAHADSPAAAEKQAQGEAGVQGGGGHASPGCAGARGAAVDFAALFRHLLSPTRGCGGMRRGPPRSPS
jgi:hypothetical protein